MQQDDILSKLEVTTQPNNEVYNELCGKLEMKLSQRLRKTARQTVRTCLSRGIFGFVGRVTARDLINRINAPSPKRKVVFVTGYPTFNLTAMSIGLRQTGQFETILLTESPWLADVTERYFDMVHVYGSYYSVARILSEIRPYIVHVQGSINYYFFAILARSLCNAPVVMGFYDIPMFGLTKEQWERMWGRADTVLDFFTEQFAFNNMDGVVLSVHCLEAGEILRNRYSSKKPLIDFHAYACGEFQTGAGRKDSDGDGRIRLAYGGHVSPSKLPREIFGDVQFIPLIEKLTAQGIQFEMYPTPYMSPIRVRQIFADYIDLSRKNPLFKYHINVPFDEAMRRASECDFGAMIYLFERGCYGEEHTRLVAPTKFFKYLEAGLPVIVSEEVQYVARIVKEYQMGIVVSQKDIDNLSDIIKDCDYNRMRTNVKKAQKEFSIERHIGRLMDFYEQVEANSNVGPFYPQKQHQGQAV